MKKKFKVRINYNGYFGQTEVFCKDTKEDVEKSILDKLGQNKVKLEKDGFTRGKWITYEEVINDGDLYNMKKSLELAWQHEHLKSGKHNIRMIEINNRSRML